jgi:heptosyltransferase-2
MTSDAPTNILIIGPSWVGDMVMSQTLYIALKKRYPNANIDVMAPEWCKGVLGRMPEVRAALSVPFKHGELNLRGRYRVGKSLRGQYDWAIVLPNSWKSALLPFFAKIPRRTGWLGECRHGILTDTTTLNKTEFPLMIDRFAALALDDKTQAPKDWFGDTHPPHPVLTFNELPNTQHAPNPKDTIAEQVGTQPKKPATQIPPPVILGLDPGIHSKQTSSTRAKHNTLALCPGAAYGATKRWPHYAKIANHYLNQGWQVQLLGAPNEQDTLEAINAECNNGCALHTGDASLEDKIDLLGNATLAICNDSGLLHIAAATQTPVIGIYGSTSPNFTPPLGAHTRIAQLDNLKCRPCFKRKCPLKGDAHLKCLIDITPEHVLTLAEDLL